jgi:hypothetical protein
LEITATEEKAAAEPETSATIVIIALTIALIITRVIIIYGMTISWIRTIPRRESDSISFSREDKGGQWT